MENKKVNELFRISELVGDLQKIIRVENSLEVFLALAVIAKKTPDLFMELYKSPIAALKANLVTLIQSNEALKEIDTLECLKDEFLSADSIAEMIYCLNEVDNFTALANVIIETYSKTQGKRGGEVSTSRAVVEIIKRYIGNTNKLKVYDGAAGICTLTSELEAAELILEDINQSVRNIGKNILVLKGIDADYRVVDSLEGKKASNDADLVITQPPWGMRLPAKKINALKNANYLVHGLGEKVPASAGDALWIQQALYHANNNGRVILLLPHGWLFRGGYDAELREHLLEHDYVQAIIGLPAGLMLHTSIPSVIVVLNKNKDQSEQGVVNFVDASGFGKEANRQKNLAQDEIDLIVKLAKGELPENEKCRAVLLPEIYQNNNDLNIKRYVKEEIEMEIPDAAEEFKKFKIAEQTFTQSQTELINLLKEATS